MNAAQTYIVVDLEWTCDSPVDIPADEKETVEIGAVAVDCQTGEIINGMGVFVRPIIHPKLSQFFCDLTSIPQAFVDATATFPHGFAVFKQWAEQQNGKAWMSWGRGDRQQFARDCGRHGVEPLALPWIDLARLSRRLCGRGQRGTMNALGIKRAGRRHRGIDDATNYARIVSEFIRRGWEIK